jgi:WD40 repeat protein/predicted Ser/Thr protein kinase
VQIPMLEQLLDRRYQITQVLAKGGFGQTYLAIDTRRPGQPTCVVKHLQADADPKLMPTIQRLFQDEADALEMLGRHSQIPQLLAYFEENGEFYLVQEFIPGRSLSQDLLSRRLWKTEQVVKLLIEILNILAFVHGQGVIHRDIKPDNLIRRQTDQALVLIDFGSVKKIREMHEPINQGVTVAIGTPAYMPMEQFNGFPKFNSDLYAVGVIGIRAISGLSAEEVRTLINPSRPSLHQNKWYDRVQVNPKLAAVLDQMVQADYQQRYPSVSAVLSDLITLQADLTATDLTTYSPTQFQSPRAIESQDALTQIETLAVPPLNPTISLQRHRSFSWWRSAVDCAITIALLSVFHYRTQLTHSLNLPLSPPASSTNIFPTVALARTLNGHSDAVWSVVLNPQNQTFISSSQDGTLKLWNLNTGRLLKTFAAHADTVRSLSISTDAQTLASGNGDNTVKIWNLPTRQLRNTLTGHRAPVWSVVLSQDGNTLVSGSADRTIKVWHVPTGRLLRTLTGHQDKVYTLSLSPDGQTLVSSSADRTIKVWDLPTGILSRTLTGHSDTVRSIAISPDGQILASASWDKTVKLWDLHKGNLLQTLTGHQARVVTIAFTASGKTLASGSLDKTIKLWNVSSGTLRQTLTGHGDWVLALATSADGQTLLSGSKDKTIKVWHGEV